MRTIIGPVRACPYDILPNHGNTGRKGDFFQVIAVCKCFCANLDNSVFYFYLFQGGQTGKGFFANTGNA